MPYRQGHLARNYIEFNCAHSMLITVYKIELVISRVMILNEILV